MIKTFQTDLICFSHLRWDFVFQRPQHLMSRFVKSGRVFFWEEPLFEGSESHLRSRICDRTGVHVLTPVISAGSSIEASDSAQQMLLERAVAERNIKSYVAWYYTPMALEFTSTIQPDCVVYDCMDELSQFAGAPPEMLDREQELFRKADMVFTGGASLFAAKRTQHNCVYLFPSSVDVEHFRRARDLQPEPSDQAPLSWPRLGYAGVIDERMDMRLLEQVADLRPEWQFIFLGPVVKIDSASLPRRKNLHFLGMKPYISLPAYFSGWQIGMLPFALNDSTRFISPTKTPEYLAAGLRVISTPIRDVASPYGEQNLVGIANDAQEFVRIAEKLLADDDQAAFRARVDQFLSASSWDKTWHDMSSLINASLTAKKDNINVPPADIQKDAVRV